MTPGPFFARAATNTVLFLVTLLVGSGLRALHKMKPIHSGRLNRLLMTISCFGPWVEAYSLYATCMAWAEPSASEMGDGFELHS